MVKDNQPKIFVSYSWKNKNVVDEIEKDFQAIGLQLKRDIRDLHYKNSLKNFMKQVRSSDYVLMIISDSYLKSQNCMYEVLEFIKDENYTERILPILLDDVDIFGINGGLQYIDYWKTLFEQSKQKLSEHDPLDIVSYHKELKEIEQITRNLG